MANMYRSVLSGGGTAPTGDATAADVLTGKTFSNAQNVGISGTMPNRGAVSASIEAGNSYTIPEGYHNGSGTVTATGVHIATKSGFHVPESITPTAINTIDISSGSGTFPKGTSVLNVDGYDQVQFNVDQAGMYGSNDLVNFTAITTSGSRTYNISSYKYITFYSASSSQTGTFT